MKKIESYAALSALITSQMKRGMVTNAFLSRGDWEREISSGTLEYEAYDCGLLVYRLRPSHRILSFWVNDGFFDEDITLPGDTVCEIPMRENDARTDEAVGKWTAAGFEHEFTRQRMASADDNGIMDEGIRRASPDDLGLCLTLLRENFSPVTGCLPDEEKLLSDIRDGGVLVYAEGSGLLHHLTEGKKTELRHLCVSESVRGQGIGEKLVLAYHALTPGLTRRVWVRSDFTPAKRIYEKCGYSADGMISRVLIRR